MKPQKTLKYFSLLFLILFSYNNSLFAQGKLFNNWYFGYYGAITFNTTPPSFMASSAIVSPESCAAISDQNGNPLFYTDGKYVYNQHNIVIYNGAGLNGHVSSTQGALIVPYPKHPNLFVVFTTDAEAGYYGGTPSGCGCFSYSIIDKNLQGGYGEVTSLNNVLYNHVTEKMTACYASDTSVWIVIHEWESNKFLSYLLSPSGVNTTPVVSSVGSSHCCTPTYGNTRGQMKISPDGKKLGLCIVTDRKLELFDFNDSTGQVGNPLSLIIPSQYDIYGFEFSNNSNLFYTSILNLNDSQILQYDLSSWDSLTIMNSGQAISTNTVSFYCQLQLGPDKKMYVAENYSSALSVIDYPDSIGNSCHFQYQFINLFDNYGSGKSYGGLPQDIRAYKEPNQTSKEMDCELVVPNVITPNFDHVNDSMEVLCEKNKFTPDDLVIYNRWGEEVYNRSAKLDRLNKIPDGVYYYVFHFMDKDYRGFISVFH